MRPAANHEEDGMGPMHKEVKEHPMGLAQVEGREARLGWSPAHKEAAPARGWDTKDCLDRFESSRGMGRTDRDSLHYHNLRFDEGGANRHYRESALLSLSDNEELNSSRAELSDNEELNSSRVELSANADPITGNRFWNQLGIQHSSIG